MSDGFYNVQNQVTGEFILDSEGVKVEYESCDQAMTAALYYTNVTGQQHVIAGPHPKPKTHA